jgi:hypothetical protein
MDVLNKKFLIGIGINIDTALIGISMYSLFSASLAQ